MTDKELNEYIKHYLEKDQTRTAIMITAPWGTGKSYYIQNSLKPFILENGDYKALVVSVYGFEDTNEISKSIYLESKAAQFKTVETLKTKSEGREISKIIGKTIIKGVTSFFGVDLSMDENEFNKLFRSIDLKDKLVVIEDIERTEIPLTMLLGYINNLVEQDGAKVILVANEEELLAKMKDEHEKNEYLKTKEKTIGDTIQYLPDLNKTLDSILSSFENSRIDSLLVPQKYDYSSLSQTILDDIILCKKIRDYNLRSIIYGIQKTIDMFEKGKVDVSIEFFKAVLLSSIAFSLRKKKNDSLKWEGDNSGRELGTYKYPLFQFAYDYFVNQLMEPQLIAKDYETFSKNLSFEMKNSALKPYFGIIYNYYELMEVDVEEAVKHVLIDLERDKIIPPQEYARLGNYLISIKYSGVAVDLVNKCKEQMVRNIWENPGLLEEEIHTYSGIQLESKEAASELTEFENDLIGAIQKNKSQIFNDFYSLENLPAFVDAIRRDRDTFVTKHRFASLFNMEKFGELLKIYSASDISKIRRAFHAVYSFSNLNDFFKEDLESLKELKTLVGGLLSYEKYDKIQQKQINYFYDSLNAFIEAIDK